jgi:hypothetical protein
VKRERRERKNEREVQREVGLFGVGGRQWSHPSQEFRYLLAVMHLNQAQTRETMGVHH